MSSGDNIRTTIDATNGSWDDSVESNPTLEVKKPAIFHNGISGSLTQLSNGSPFIVGGTNITTTTGSNGQVTISTEGSTLWRSTLNNTIFTTGSIQVSGSGLFKTGISGSLTHLADGTSYLVAGPNVFITSASNGSITITAAVTSSIAAQGGDHEIQYNDTGAVTGSNLLWFDNDDHILYVSGGIKTGYGLFSSGLTGALNVLPDGSPFILGGTNIVTATGSNGQITLSTQGNTLWQTTTNNVIFTTGSIQITGSANVTGSLNATSAKFTSGLTGALNVLPDGSPTLIAGNFITLSTGSSGAVTITSNTGSSFNISASTGNIVLTAPFSNYVVFLNSASGSFSVTLPNATTNGSGSFLHLKKISTDNNTITVSASSGQTIDGSATQIFSLPYVAIKLISYNNNWWIL